LPRGDGYRFCVLHKPPPEFQARGTVLYVHPFADELNLSRRMIAHTARQLAEDGWIVLLLDLFGCGDSSGDFGEASWPVWLDDIRFAFGWLQSQHPRTPVLWGLRAGCLLISQVVHCLPCQPHLILWQPLSSGRVFLSQFLRLKVAADMLADRAERAGVKGLGEQLARGAAVEIGGYALSPRLALPLEAAELEIPHEYKGHVIWCEVSARDLSKKLLHSSEIRVQRWREAGIKVSERVVGGPTFWHAQEITENQELADALRGLMKSLT
jgi:exosortase A-associated hydrolase 2